MEHDLLTTAETCEQLRISRMTLFRWATEGRIAPIRLSARANRWRRADVEALCVVDDSAVVLRGALELLAEEHANEKRVLCPGCGHRRVNPGGDLCTPCDEQTKLQLSHKRKWWDANGAAAKERQRAKRAAASA